MDGQYRVPGIPFPLSEEEYYRMRRPSVFDSPAFRFRMQSDEEQSAQTLAMAQHKLAAVYRELARWFAGPDAKLFGISCWSASGQDWGWGNSLDESSRRFRKWIPAKASGLQEIADVVTCGAYDIEEMGRRKLESGYDSNVLARAAADIIKVYESAAWFYDGPEFPGLPRFQTWRRNLAWFAKCRDMLGAVPMLEAYASGVPVEDIVMADVKRLRLEWEMEKTLAGQCDVFVEGRNMRFPHMNRASKKSALS